MSIKEGVIAEIVRLSENNCYQYGMNRRGTRVLVSDQKTGEFLEIQIKKRRTSIKCNPGPPNPAVDLFF